MNTGAQCQNTTGLAMNECVGCFMHKTYQWLGKMFWKKMSLEVGATGKYKY